jgi:hypothetical protein
MKNNQVGMFKTKTSINQIKLRVDSVISRQNQTEEKMSEMEDKIEGLVHVNNQKENK